MATECGCTAFPGREESHPSCKRAGKAHVDKRHIPDSTASQGKDDSRPPGHTGFIPGGYSGRVALRREQCNREQQLLVVSRLAKLPELFRTRGQNILGVSSAARNNAEAR